MTLGAKRSRPQLQKGLDRDVYLVLKKLEDSNDGKPFKTATAVYEAIKGSNSSLSRQKKRPLEDSIDRVFQYRKEELGQDSSDSEAALEEPPKPDDDRFLLNRQMTKHWHQNSTTASTPAAQDTAAQNSSEGARSTKKRRVQEDGDERAKDGAVTPKGALTDTDAPAEKQTKTPIKKTQKSSRHKVEHPSDAVQIGGVSDIYVELCKQTHPLLKRPESCQAMRKVPGILLSGPPGTGKRSLIRFLASKIDVPIVSLTECLEDPERLERSLNDAVEEAMRLAPCIVLIEQLDWYMSKPGSSSHSDSQRRNVVQFRRQMRRIEAEQDKDRHILAMATTSQITDVDPEVLRTGLFERTIQMRIPDAEGREDILRLLTKDKKLSDDVNFKELAKITHGFVGADILNVLTLAEQLALERYMDLSLYQQHLNERFPTDQPLPDLMELEDTQPPTPFLEPPLDDPLTREDFKKAIKDFVPSLRKDGFTVVPNITWDQVGALQAARRQLELSIIGPIRDPNRYRRHGLRRPAGCLLWGPPGCGKTLVAQAVANEAQASFILINGPELLNKYVGESERAVRELFNRARSSTPCILFFDEMDSLVPKRDNASTDAGTRVVNALLTELDGVQDRTGVYVIGTTNRPDMIDPAMLRPGRLNVRLFLDLPSPNERVDILHAIYRTNHPDATPAEFEKLEAVARDPRCTDFSGADLGGLHEKAAESSLEREAEKPESAGIDEVDWEYALSRTYRSVTNPETYRKLEAKMGKS